MIEKIELRAHLSRPPSPAQAPPRLLAFALVLLALSSTHARRLGVQSTTGTGLPVVVGTYGPGIFSARWAPESGLSALALATEIEGSSWQALANLGNSASARVVYSVSEVASFNRTPNSGGLYSYALDLAANGPVKLVPINAQPTRGAAPCDVSFVPASPGGSKTPSVLVANYNGGSVISYAVDPVTGAMGAEGAFIQFEGHGPNLPRQDGPHAHQIISPDGKLVLAVDLGNDRVRSIAFLGLWGENADLRTGGQIYSFFLTNNSQLVPSATGHYNVTPAGSGPRHLLVDARSPAVVFLIDELALTFQVLKVDLASGSMSRVGQAVSLLPPGTLPSPAYTAAELVQRDHFIYASVRGLNIVTTISLAAGVDKPVAVAWTPSGGEMPRFLTLDPSLRFLLVAHQSSNSIVTFEIQDDAVGSLKKISEASVPSPVCITFLT